MSETFEVPKRIAVKERLPDEREGVTHHFCITDRDGRQTDGYITIGLYEDGRPGELFLKTGKQGDQSAVWDFAVKMASAALQYGAPLENLCAKMIGAKYEPSGHTTNKDIPRCTSIEDYLGRYLMGRFGKTNGR